MSGCRIAVLVPAITALALAASPHPAGATAIIKTFHISICVTGDKHADGCKNARADARLVVPDDQMDELDAEIGQGASIMALPSSGGAPSPPEHRRPRLQNDEPPQPGM